MGYYKRLLIARALASRLAARAVREKQFHRDDYLCVDAFRSLGVPDDGGHRVLMECHMDVLSRVFGSVPKADTDRAATDAEFSRKFPILFELLTSTPKGEGKRRETSTLTMLAEDGQWKAGLRDRSMNVSLWRSGACFTDALAALEKALAADVVDWRRSPVYFNKNRKS